MSITQLLESADSLRKASTPEPFSASRTSNWVARGGGLPPYIQHIAHDLMEKRGKSESEAIEMAVGIVKRWARGGGQVDAGTRAAAAKAVAEWEKLKAGAKVKSAVQHSYVPTIDAEMALREAALERVAGLAGAFGMRGLAVLIEGATVECPGCGRKISTNLVEPNVGTKVPKAPRVRECCQGALQEASGFSPTLKRVPSATGERERFDLEHEGQTVGSIARRPGFEGKPDRYHARAVNGEEIAGGYSNPLKSKAEALQAVQSHLAEAPARVISLPTAGKYLVARPSTYGQTSYTEFPNEPAARHAAGLPPSPTLPERSSQVAKLGEMLRLDLAVLEGQDIPPLAPLQEARRRVPLAAR